MHGSDVQGRSLGDGWLGTLGWGPLAHGTLAGDPWLGTPRWGHLAGDLLAGAFNPDFRIDLKFSELKLRVLLVTGCPTLFTGCPTLFTGCPTLFTRCPTLFIGCLVIGIDWRARNLHKEIKTHNAATAGIWL